MNGDERLKRHVQNNLPFHDPAVSAAYE